MKNKLLVSVFAMGIAAFAFTSCETKSNVTAVCTDMVKESLHKTPRSLLKVEGQSLTIYEYEFQGGVNDNRLDFRTITFGNGVFTPKVIDHQTYEYGEWSDKNTTYSLRVFPSAGEPYTLLYRSNSLITPEGLTIGGEGSNNTARVEKWEKTINNFPNTDWEATFRGEFVMDSIFRDSIRTIFIPPMTFITDTIKVYTGEMDTISADTTCYYRIEFNRNPNTFANTGHYYRESVRTKYDREKAKADTISVDVKEYDFAWFFTDITSDSKFVITLDSKTEGIKGESLSISKYKLDDAGNPADFVLGGLTYTRPVLP